MAEFKKRLDDFRDKVENLFPIIVKKVYIKKKFLFIKYKQNLVT